MDDWFADDRTTLPEELAGRIKPELAPGERLLWAARSRSGLRSWTISLANWLWMVLSGLVAFLGLGAGCLGLLGKMLQEPAAVALIIGEIAFTVFLASSGLAVHTWVMNRGWGLGLPATIYALTDLRAIVWRPDAGRGGLEIFSFPPGTFRQVHRRENPDGSGDVILSPVVGLNLMSDPPKGFEGVADVARVERLVRDTLLNEPVEDPIPVHHPLRGPRRWEAGQVDAGGG
jgi:hypothetical protein